jgi:hypothetical protein
MFEDDGQQQKHYDIRRYEGSSSRAPKQSWLGRSADALQHLSILRGVCARHCTSKIAQARLSDQVELGTPAVLLREQKRVSESLEGGD